MNDPLSTLPARAAQASLSQNEVARYSRHLIMPEVGVDGQKRLKAASVLLVGAGGLGSPLGLYLAAAGVGRLGIVEFDVVDASNLQRQILHGTPRVGTSKLDSARERIAELNPNVVVEAHERERARYPGALRRDRRRHRQLPDPLPRQRRMRHARQAQRLRQHLPL